ncbi:MAG: zinc ribbon domain-containing protein [Chloroflexi bacterium]|nr:zinc ribbon domain-containing protein [Chloroflexota bacterium]MBI4506977.1 zinc ribbon domain-containing protein [Chloroflexota bacterium]
MPTYEYRCPDCNARTSIFVQRYEPPAAPTCRQCGGSGLERLIFAPAYHRADGDRLADLDTSHAQGEDYYRDDRNVGLWAKRRLQELGHDPGPEFEGIIEKAKKETKEMLSS